MPLNRLINYLEENNKKYVVVKHSTAYTAQEIAASAHIPGKEMVKTVIVKADGDPMMVVLPSTHDVDLDSVRDTLNADNVELATEDEFEAMFPDCDLGAMPPFGNFYDMDTLVAECLTDDEEIAFNAGSHRELVRMNYSDFEELLNPQIMPVGMKKV